MELTVQELEIIKEASRKIDFGQIVIDFTGHPTYTVDIKATENHRFQRYKKPAPTTGKFSGKGAQGNKAITHNALIPSLPHK